MRRTLRKVAQAVAVAGMCAGLALSGSTTAVAAPATGNGTQANLLYSVDGGSTWSESVTAQRGQTVHARLFYNSTRNIALTGVSLSTAIPDGFTYVPGSTRNQLAPRGNLTTGAAGSETKTATVADSVWSANQLRVSPSAGWYGEPTGSQSGFLRNGVKRYLNLHQCGWWDEPQKNTVMSWVWNSQTNVSNTRDTTLGCGSYSGRPRAEATGVTGFDLLGSRYLNLDQCAWWNAATKNTVPSVLWGTQSQMANAASSAISCGTYGENTVADERAGLALDLVSNRYVNLRQCAWWDAANENTVTSLIWRSGTNSSNTANSFGSCQTYPGTPRPAANEVGTRSLDLLDTARGTGFVQFAFRSDVPAAPACEEVVSLPAVTSTRQGTLTGTGTGDPASTAGITLAAYSVTGDDCPEEPRAVTDEYTTVQDTPLSGNVLDNDLVPDGSTITVTGPGAGPWHGQLVLNPDGTFTFTPDAGYVGTDSFSYTITDQNGATSVATVNITITEDENGIPLLAPGAAFAGLLGLGGLGLYRRKEQQTA